MNEARVPLIMFPRHIFFKAIMGMASSLKGIGTVKRLTIYLRNGEGDKGNNKLAQVKEEANAS